jgi:hypothetical protein
MTACERQSNGWMFIGSTENDIYLRLRLVSTLDSMGIACLLHQHEAASQEKTGCWSFQGISLKGSTYLYACFFFFFSLTWVSESACVYLD